MSDCYTYGISSKSKWRTHSLLLVVEKARDPESRMIANRKTQVLFKVGQRAFLPNEEKKFRLVSPASSSVALDVTGLP